MEAFLGRNYIMVLNKLPSIGEYCRVDTFIQNLGFKKPLFEIVSSKFFKTFISLTTLRMMKLTVHSK